VTITNFNNVLKKLHHSSSQDFWKKCIGLNIQYEKRLAANSHAPPLDFIFKLSALKMMIQDGSGLIF
jgi:hypothetical protein